MVADPVNINMRTHSVIKSQLLFVYIPYCTILFSFSHSLFFLLKRRKSYCSSISSLTSTCMSPFLHEEFSGSFSKTTQSFDVNHDVILFSRFVMQSPCSYCSIKFLTEFETRCSPFGWRVCHHRFSYNYFRQTCQLNLGSSVCVLHVVTLIVLHCRNFPFHNVCIVLHFMSTVRKSKDYIGSNTSTSCHFSSFIVCHEILSRCTTCNHWLIWRCRWQLTASVTTMWSCL